MSEITSLCTSEGSFRELRIRDLRLDFSIGVNAEEHHAPQPVLINILAYIQEDGPHTDDTEYVCYCAIVEKLRTLAAQNRHVRLVETLAEETAALVLEEPRILRTIITVEKPDIIPEAAAVGVRIERRKS